MDSCEMGTQIVVIGPIRLQNKLLTQYLEKETGFLCACALNLEDLKSLVHNKTLVGKPIMALWDCTNVRITDIWADIEHSLSLSNDFLTSLFNVDPNKGIELEAAQRGINGVFPDIDPPGTLLKGIRAIMRGELWFSRETLIVNLTGKKLAPTHTKPDHDLTAREIEILELTAPGRSNQEIAEQLSISRNTVRTHLYNIFGKIGVHNRFQAILWAAKNL